MNDLEAGLLAYAKTLPEMEADLKACERAGRSHPSAWSEHMVRDCLSNLARARTSRDAFADTLPSYCLERLREGNAVWALQFLTHANHAPSWVGAIEPFIPDLFLTAADVLFKPPGADCSQERADLYQAHARHCLERMAEAMVSRVLWAESLMRRYPTVKRLAKTLVGPRLERTLFDSSTKSLQRTAGASYRRMMREQRDPG